MAKDRERSIARTYFTELGKTCKEIATLIGVSEQTLSNWRAKEGWDDIRSARMSRVSVRTDNIRQIINGLAEQRIELDEDLKKAEIRGNAEETAKILQKIASVDDGVSKWNKTLENLTKEDKLSIGDHLVVMERLFDEMRRYDEKLYLATIDFQEHYLQQITANG
jgi:DNA-directed RNA polymerase specialized sigma subunit